MINGHISVEREESYDTETKNKREFLKTRLPMIIDEIVQFIDMDDKVFIKFTIEGKPKKGNTQ